MGLSCGHLITAALNDGKCLFDETFRSTHTRALTPEEVHLLVSQGNASSEVDWSNIRIWRRLPTFRWDAKSVQRSRFVGQVVLGSFEGSVIDNATGLSLPCGIYDATLGDVVVHSHTLVERCAAISRCVVNEGAIVQGCQTITCSSNSTCSNNTAITVGPESGGREAIISVDSTLEDIAVQYMTPGNKRSSSTASTTNFTVIGSGARVVGCEIIDSCLIGPNVVIAHSILRHSTIMGQPDAPSSVSSSEVRKSVVQRNCHVESKSYVENSLLCEHSKVHRNGVVISSVIGPFSGVSDGEVNSSILGPFVGFHHQSLLVAAFWPGGRGNIGYGANVGSNHTGKLNDQELWVGEGVFFGLGTCIKYPCNLSAAPYTLVATGVTMLPQKISMPFSLVNVPSEFIQGISPSFNEISPGWLLSDNMYMIYRNEMKYSARQLKHSNSTPTIAYSNRILRPSMIKLLIDAKKLLMSVKGSCKFHNNKGEGIYTDSDVPGGIGIGKNYMRESTRVAAIDAYSMYIELFVLEQLCGAIQTGQLSFNSIDQVIQNDDDCVKRSPATKASRRNPTRKSDIVARRLNSSLPSNNLKSTGASLTGIASNSETTTMLKFALQVLKSENQIFKSLKSESDLARRYLDLLYKQAEGIRKSKQKDFSRGKRIIDDYNEVHGAVDDDSIVAAAFRKAIDFERSMGIFGLPPKSNL